MGSPFHFPRQLARNRQGAPPLDLGLVIDSSLPRGKGADALKAFLDAFAPRRTRIGIRVDGNNLVLPVLDRYQQPWDLVESCFLDVLYDLTEGVSLSFLPFRVNYPLHFLTTPRSSAEEPRRARHLSRQHASGEKRQAASSQGRHRLEQQQRSDSDSSARFYLEGRPPRA